MKSFFFGLAAAALCAVSTGSASAQWIHNRNVISNSGNGAGNVIQASNHAYPGGYGGYDPGFAQPTAGYGYGGGYNAGYAPPAPVFGGGIGGGRLINRIVNSGNGVGNVIAAQNAGGFGGYSPFGPGGFGVNVNVIANSGNGVGNVVQGMNRSLGGNGLNLNFVTNSGNGAYNQIGAFNR